MGYTQVADLTHHMENLLDALRQGEVAATGDLINILFDAVDLLEIVLEEVISTDHVYTDTSQVKEALALVLSNSGWRSGFAQKAAIKLEAPALGLNEYDRERSKRPLHDYTPLAVTSAKG